MPNGKLTIEVEFQYYGETEEERLEVCKQVRDAIDAVVGLCDLAVGTFVRSTIEVPPYLPISKLEG